MGLAQADFSAGMVRNVARDLIPQNGAYDIRDALLDDDGNVYQRGPTSRLSSNQLGAAARAFWEGQFTAGRRMFGVAATAIGAIGPSNAWVSMAAGAGLTGGGLAAQIGEIMFFPYFIAGTGNLIGAYAGSLKAAAYATGTVTVTNGSATVTGVGTAWLANVDAGMLLVVGAAPNAVYAVVRSVDSNTQITLIDTWEGPTTAGTAYSLQAFAAPTVGAGGSSVTTVGGRLLVANGRRLSMSQTIDPATGRSRWYKTFATVDYHDFPADIVAVTALRDIVYVFTKSGVWSITNVALEIVDAFGNPQHRVQKVSGDVVLRSPGGLAPWRDSMVVCAVDGVYVMDITGRMELVSRSITPLWQAHMQAGDTVGQAMTFRDHVFVPVGAEILVGRLDRTVPGPAGRSSPWSRLSFGEAGLLRAFAVQDPYGTPKLVAGSSGTGYVIDCTAFFIGSALPTTAPTDSDGSGYGFVLDTREFRLGGGLTQAFVRQLMLDYESTDGTIGVFVSKMVRATPGADPTMIALTTAPPGNYTTQAPAAVAVGKSSRRVAFRFTAATAIKGVRMRGFLADVRERGLQR